MTPMSPMIDSRRNERRPQRAAMRLAHLTLIAVSATTLLAACGDKKKDAATSQTAAKVNKEEITVHQINFVLQQQRGLKPEQAETASKQILERLIDQEIALQKAQELKIDRDPRVVQQLEAARREIVARAYVERTGETAAKPSPADIKKYYEEKPALFKERRIYNIQEIQIEAKPDQIPTLRTQLQQAKAITEFVEYLKANNIRFGGNQAVRPAEQLPLTMLDTFAKLKDGQAILIPTPNGAQVVVLAGSRSEPVDEARATPAIEQFLWNDAKRKLLEANMKTLRGEAKIQYVGKFSAPASGAATGAAPTSLIASEPAVGTPAPVAPVPAAPSPSASGLNADDISKGMGLKK